MARALVWLAVAAWAGLGLYVSATDLRRAIIPRRAVWSVGATVALLLTAAAMLSDSPTRLFWALAGAATVGVLMECIYRLLPGRIGYGDVRLILVNSLLAGWWGIEWSWWSLCAGAVAEWPVAVLAIVREGRGATVRWAPGLVIGTALVLGYSLWTRGPLL